MPRPAGVNNNAFFEERKERKAVLSPRQPDFVTRERDLKVSVWRNELREELFFNVKVSRVYYDKKTGEQKQSDYLTDRPDRGDLLGAAKLLEAAHVWCRAQRALRIRRDERHAPMDRSGVVDSSVATPSIAVKPSEDENGADLFETK